MLVAVVLATVLHAPPFFVPMCICLCVFVCVRVPMSVYSDGALTILTVSLMLLS